MLLSHRSLLVAAAALVAGATLAIPAAEASGHKKRPLTVKVPARSYFDAGRVVPVGSLSHYSRGPHFHSAPVYQFNGARFGESSLPDRIGGGAPAFPRF